MTPDSPKGPEREARSYSVVELRDRIAQEISEADGGASSVEPCGDATYQQMADAALFVVSPVLERLTAEVERLRDRVHTAVDQTQRRFAQYQSRCDKFDGWSKWARDEYERHGDRWGMQSEATRLIILSLLEEHDELRQAAEAEAELLDQEQAERKAEVSRLREQLAAQQPVWAPADPTDESARLASALRFVGVVDPDDDCMSVFDTTGEGIKHWVPVDAIALRMLEHGWGVSSSEVEAPQPQAFKEDARNLNSPAEVQGKRHEVLIERRESMFYAKCSLCQNGTQSHNEKFVEFWKDQHEADTLRPKAFADYDLADVKPGTGFFVEKDDEGRPSGSERLAPRPVAQDEYIVRTADNGNLPQQIRKVGVHRPVWVDVDCPSCGDAGGCGHADLLCCEECDDNWPCNVVANVAEELERMAFRVEGEPVRVLIGRARELRGDAAQAARSEATPEEGEWMCRDCGHPKNPFDHEDNSWMCARHRPSPSLRKEGEDSD